MKKIVIVEDSSAIINLAKVLRKAGHEVLAILPCRERSRTRAKGHIELSTLMEISRAIIAFEPELALIDHNYSGLFFSGDAVVANAKLPREKVICISIIEQRYSSKYFGAKELLGGKDRKHVAKELLKCIQ